MKMHINCTLIRVSPAINPQGLTCCLDRADASDSFRGLQACCKGAKLRAEQRRAVRRTAIYIASFIDQSVRQNTKLHNKTSVYYVTCFHFSKHAYTNSDICWIWVSHSVYQGAGIAQSVKQLVMGWTTERLEFECR
jgi:hypothetical protein